MQAYLTDQLADMQDLLTGLCLSLSLFSLSLSLSLSLSTLSLTHTNAHDMQDLLTVLCLSPSFSLTDSYFFFDSPSLPVSYTRREVDCDAGGSDQGTAQKRQKV